MKGFFLSSFLLAGLLPAIAQKVVIVGKADMDYFGKEIILARRLDGISEREVVLKRDTLKKPGFFTFETEIKSVTPLFIRSGNRVATLYASPGKTYKIGLMKPDSGTIEVIGNRVPVRLVFMNGDSTDLNFLISYCDEELDRLLKNEKGVAVVDQRPKDLKPDSAERKKPHQLLLKRKIDSLEKKIRTELAWSKDPFFQTYLTYTFAGARLPLVSHHLSWDKYLSGKIIQYDHPAFMEFCAAFYSAELEYRLYTNSVLVMVNEGEDCIGFRDKMKHLTFTPNDTLKELAALILLRAANDIKEYKKERLCATISHAQGAYKLPLHKEIAANLNYMYCRLVPGADIPSLSFVDLKGANRTLSEFNGKFIYLMYWRADITVCEEQMRLIPELKRKYGQKIAFVAVFLDKDPTTIRTLLKKYPKSDFEVFFPAPGSEALEIFNVKAVPLYFLINTFQRLALSPAPEPGLDIEKKFDEIKKKGNKAFIPGQKEN